MFSLNSLHMKLYSKKKLNETKLSEYNKKLKKETLLISDEGIFKIYGSNVCKMILTKDEIEDTEHVIFDKSEYYFIDYNKIPFTYTKIDYDQKIFIVNDHISIICVNDSVWYVEFSNLSHYSSALNIIANSV